ncbi:MAG: type II secretion system protein [Candidatus Riflebacteria bacterium]|nr:type II secretion system protein [Candidatus Riflebacteria bacterium]
MNGMKTSTNFADLTDSDFLIQKDFKMTFFALIMSVVTQLNQGQLPHISGNFRFRKGLIISHSGFTLTEVLVSTMVISMILITLVSSVWMSSQVWQRGQQESMLMNQVRTIHEMVLRDLNNAILVASPAYQANSSYLIYDLPVASPSPNAVSGTGTFLLFLDSTTNTLRRNWINTTLPAAASAALLSRFQFLIARDVATFVLYRPTTYTVQVTIGVQSTFQSTGASMTLDSTDTYLLPGVQ